MGDSEIVLAIRAEGAAIAALASPDPAAAIAALGGTLYLSPGLRGQPGTLRAVVPRSRSTVAAFYRDATGRWRGPMALSVGDATAYVASCQPEA